MQSLSDIDHKQMYPMSNIYKLRPAMSTDTSPLPSVSNNHELQGSNIPSRHTLNLSVNGTAHTLDVESWVPLLDLLRERFKLTGTKKGCDQGQCGACTVLVDGKRINSCLTLAVMQEGRAITTVEGLATGDVLHPLQEAFISHDAFQCGYCTPGQLCSAVGLINEGEARTEAGIRELMSGNVCRCGAYPQIVPYSVSRIIYALVIGTASLCTASFSHAADRYGSVLFQNDAFVGHDGGGYTNGTFFSSIRVPTSNERIVTPGVLLANIAPILGLPEAMLTIASFGQIMVTPADITRRVPYPTDAPYVGALAFRSAQIYIEGETADMTALTLGVIGPAAGAKQTQRFIHRLTGSNEPKGWGTQVSNRPLFGLDRARSWRFPWSTSTGEASGDAIVQATGTLGNLESSAGGNLLLRYGTGLAKSFPTTAIGDGRGADPFLVGQGWFLFAGLAAARVFNHIGIHGDAKLRNYRMHTTLGVAYGWESSSLTFSLQSEEPVVEDSKKRQRYGSLTYVVRFP